MGKKRVGTMGEFVASWIGIKGGETSEKFGYDDKMNTDILKTASEGALKALNDKYSLKCTDEIFSSGNPSNTTEKQRDKGLAMLKKILSPEEYAAVEKVALKQV